MFRNRKKMEEITGRPQPFTPMKNQSLDSAVSTDKQSNAFKKAPKRSASKQGSAGGGKRKRASLKHSQEEASKRVHANEKQSESHNESNVGKVTRCSVRLKKLPLKYTGEYYAW